MAHPVSDEHLVINSGRQVRSSESSQRPAADRPGALHGFDDGPQESRLVAKQGFAWR